MEKQGFAAEGLLQVPLQYMAHLGELRKHQRAVAFGQHFLKHLGQPRQFAGSARDRRIDRRRIDAG